MDFKEFTDRIAELLKQKMGDGYTVTVREVLKNNDVRLTGAVITKGDAKISPTIYLEEPYRRYQEGEDMEEIADEIMAAYESSVPEMRLDLALLRDFSRAKGRIFPKLINHGKNQEMLADVPHFKWHDLAVTFYYVLEEEASVRGSITIHNSHLELWGKTAEEIYRTAMRNMEQKMPDVLISLDELVEEITGIRLEKSSSPFYVLSNRERRFGASAVLGSEKVRELADSLGADLLILPSSIHELILLPDDGSQGYDYYRNMVYEVNTTQVEPEEILSFNLYRYDRQKEEIEEIPA